MGAPCQGTCTPWATVADVSSPCDDYEFDEALLEDALQVASDVLFDLTGRAWAGSCTEVVRPCSRYRATGHAGGWHDGRTWAGWCGCARRRSCGCSRLSEIRLGGYPITGITAVKVDGDTLDPSLHRVDDHRWLVRLPDPDGTNPGWPCCQDLALPDTDEGTFSVEYVYGVEPPRGGVRAAASLGCQLALAWSPETVGQCRLPKRVTTIARQGVTLAVLDPLTLFRDGLTGLSDVDLWVASVWMGRKRRRSTVVVPGQGRAVRRAGT